MDNLARKDYGRRFAENSHAVYGVGQEVDPYAGRFRVLSTPRFSNQESQVDRKLFLSSGASSDSEHNPLSNPNLSFRS